MGLGLDLDLEYGGEAVIEMVRSGRVFRKESLSPPIEGPWESIATISFNLGHSRVKIENDGQEQSSVRSF